MKVYIVIGHLSTIKNPSCAIQNSTVHLTWTAPFSLNIVGIHPDIEGYRVYMIDNANRIVESYEVITSEFSLDIHSNEQCFSADFIVTAVNAVGEGDGSRVSCSLPLNSKCCCC